MTDPRQGDIFWVVLDPVLGSEQAGKRPVVVVSGNTLNDGMPIRIVCPLTGRVMGKSGRVSIPKTKANGLKKDSDVLVFQVRTLSPLRFRDKIGHITGAQMQSIVATLGELLTY
ncbi:type II toxin-antitoxin system PemK/MazF family toxin [Candidatus Kaiserbacteria bacterium]|nr:type II toxin-antitoxin system PemK/MazF family toxin [Candidatus Kaiserbacteria bacterium]